MGEYPTEINDFHFTLYNLSGIEDVCSGIDNLEEVKRSDLFRADLSHLPIAALLRTNGGYEDELLLQFEFGIDNSKESLISLEFLSWFFRDQARSGEKIQLRTFALPPDSPEGRQLGHTLKFHIDYFFDEITDTLQPVLDKVKALNDSLKLFISLYKVPVKDI